MSLVRAIVCVALASAIGALPRAAQTTTHTYVVRRDASSLYVVTHRAGLLSFLGHEHAIVPLDWSARLCLADPVGSGSSGSLAINSASLVVDSDSARALAGLGGGPGADDRRDIQAKMLDADHLDAEAFPEILLELTVMESTDSNPIVAEGTLDLHGTERGVRVPVTVEPAADGTLRLSGTLRIRQRDFGIEPESRAGVVKVSNDVDLHFSISAEATDAPCRPGAP